MNRDKAIKNKKGSTLVMCEWGACEHNNDKVCTLDFIYLKNEYDEEDDNVLKCEKFTWGD